jgi:hypothetical protein
MNPADYRNVRWLRVFKIQTGYSFFGFWNSFRYDLGVLRFLFPPTLQKDSGSAE